MTDLSLLMAYRNRPENLHSILDWFGTCQELTEGQVELIIVESSLEATEVLKKLDNKNIKYKHIKEEGPFNLSKLLNEALTMAEGRFVASYDVDLVPFDLSLSLHLRLAEESNKLLISGFRVNTDIERFSPEELSMLQSRATIATEDIHEGFMIDQLINKHRYGVVPFFERERIEAIGGWDESFVGWGCEDQDIIHRYLGKERYLLRSPDLVYLHLKHGHSEGWNDGDMTKINREKLFKKLNLHPSIE